MKKYQSSPSSSRGKSAAIDRIIGRLAEAIDQMPLESMISSVRFPGEPGYSDVNKAETEATNAIKALSFLAEIGRKDAAIALRNVGNLAAKGLGLLVTNPVTAVSKNDRARPIAEAPNLQTVYLLPVVDIEGDISAITDILKSEAKLIDALSEEDIRTRVGDPRIAGRRQCVVNALSLLGIPKDVLETGKLLTNKKSMRYDHPAAILEMLYGEVQRSKDLSVMRKRQKRARIAMYELIAYLLEDRLSKPSKADLGELPSNSFEWPLCVSAFSNDILERYKSLKLGHSLRFVPRRTVDKGVGKKRKSAGGRTRLIEPGGPAHFALEYCTALDDVRRMNINSSDAEKAGFKSTIKRIKKYLKGAEKVPLVIADMRDAKEAKRLEGGLDTFYQGQTLRTLWTLKSALLPEFPTANPKSDQTASADLELWISAAVARARMICSDKWDHYYGWPACVTDRIGDSRERSVQSAVREKLKEGMERLEPETSTV